MSFYKNLWGEDLLAELVLAQGENLRYGCIGADERRHNMQQNARKERELKDLAEKFNETQEKVLIE